jgi:soluble lytic murein transglycosylase
VWLAVSLCAFAAVQSGAQSGPAAAETELEQLCRSLRTSGAAADRDRLAAFVERHARSEIGARAALALGHHEYTQKRPAEAQRWLVRAEGDPVLREYALYWGALADRAAGAQAAAIAKLEKLRRDFPDSVLADSALVALAQSALAIEEPKRALAFLSAERAVDAKPDLLVLRAQANDRAGQLEAAARDYAAIYYQYPRRPEAQPAEVRIRALRASLGKRFPAVPVEWQLARADALFQARQWTGARLQFSQAVPRLNGAARQRAELRVAQCGVSLGAAPSVLASLKVADAEVDAERLYALSQIYRARRREADMLDAVEEVARRYPQSSWTDEALFAAGNYFWVALDRTRAGSFYRRLAQQFPAGSNARTAQWRAAWVAYIERSPDTAAQIEEHLRRFPGSPFTANALYWLGRLAERAGQVPHARSFYLKLLNRLPETYFGMEAAKRMQAIGAGTTTSSDVLGLIPPAPALPVLAGPVSPAAEKIWQRGRALRMIGFDASAELEFRAAHAASGSPAALMQAAQAAMDAGRYFVGISATRQVYPQLEARRLDEGPADVWRLVYPLVYKDEIGQAAERAGVDAMLAAGIIRQESVFQSDAVSRAGAVGLMQVMPRTGRGLARRLGLPYSRARLTQPEYNLRLGTTHLAGVLKQFPVLEDTLAAYNAGEHRVIAWRAERAYEEPAEFVESIPFSETREYVQVVIRNVEIYRRLYGNQP